MANWKDIDTNFTKKIQKEWEMKGFNYEEVRKWVVDVGLKIDESDFANYLEEQGYNHRVMFKLW